MIQASSVFDTYINANILLVVAFSLWLTVRFLLNRFGLKNAYTLQLRLLNCVFLAILLSPFIAYGFNLAAQNQLLPHGFSINLSDIALAQFLNGSFEMPASDFENVLAMRETLRTNIMQPTGWFGILIATLILLGFAGFLTRGTIAALRLKKIVNESYSWRQFGNLRLRLSDKTLVPFSTRGLRNRYIVIPSGMLAQPGDLRISLAHEFQHMRQRDVEWELGMELFKSLFFWNPVIYFWKRQIEQLRELACDQNVLARNRFDVQAYCDCLIRVCQNNLRQDRATAISLPRVGLVQIERPVFGKDCATLLRQRILSMIDPGIAAQATTRTLWLTIPLVLGVAVSTVAIQHPSDWSLDRLMLSSIINLERLEALNNAGQ